MSPPIRREAASIDGVIQNIRTATNAIVIRELPTLKEGGPRGK
jgi:hypothetical protein